MHDVLGGPSRWLVALGAMVALAGAYAAISPGHTVQATTPGGFVCPRNISAQECADLKGQSNATSTQSPSPPTRPPTMPSTSQTPPLVNSGSAMFTSQQQTALADNYGLITTVRYDNRWIVVGNGESADAGATPTPGGTLLAVETCQGPTMSSCQNPDLPHSLASFTVVPLPSSLSTLTLLAYGGGYLYFANNFTLDLTTLKWYRAMYTSVAADPSPCTVPHANTVYGD